MLERCGATRLNTVPFPDNKEVGILFSGIRMSKNEKFINTILFIRVLPLMKRFLILVNPPDEGYKNYRGNVYNFV